MGLNMPSTCSKLESPLVSHESTWWPYLSQVDNEAQARDRSCLCGQPSCCQRESDKTLFWGDNV